MALETSRLPFKEGKGDNREKFTQDLWGTESMSLHCDTEEHSVEPVTPLCIVSRLRIPGSVLEKLLVLQISTMIKV
jgi:hypothetical protein